MNGPDNNIGWCDFTANPVSGKCLYNCPDCYAERIRIRYGKPEKIEFHPDWLDVSQYIRFVDKYNRAPRIFVGSMHDLFGNWIRDKEIQKVIDRCRIAEDMREPYRTPHNPQFIFCTQNPKRYQEFNWPDNCWLGTTIRIPEETERIKLIMQTKAKIHFVSFEPLLSKNLRIWDYALSQPRCGKFDWAIIGCKTPYHKDFQIEWLKDLLYDINRMETPVFIKKLPDEKGKAIDDMIRFPEWARRREWPQEPSKT